MERDCPGDLAVVSGDCQGSNRSQRMGKSRNKNKGGSGGGVARVNPMAPANGRSGRPKVESDEEALNQIHTELTTGT